MRRRRGRRSRRESRTGGEVPSRGRCGAHRRGCGKKQGPAFNIRFAVGQPKSITGKEPAGAFIPYTEMMAGMARSVEEDQLPSIQVDLKPVGRLDDAVRVYRNDLVIMVTKSPA